MQKFVGLAVVLAIVAGCSKDEMKQAYEDAKSKTQEITDTAVAKVEESLPESGSIELRTTPTLTVASQATIEVISIGDGRPSALQIYSYDPNSVQVAYPAIHLHGPTVAVDVASLTGETVMCDMYLQIDGTAMVAMTKPGESVRVTFNSFDAEAGIMTAGISAVELIRSDDQSISVSGGNIVAVSRSTAR